jgi:N utilization substance protein B
MLNRRILRIKAMQSLYAFKQAEESDTQLALAKLKEHYQDKLYIIGLDQKQLIDAETKTALDYFNTHAHHIRDFRAEKTEPDSPQAKATEILLYLKDLVEKDLQHFRERMIFEAEKLNGFYIKVLSLIKELGDTVLRDKQKRDKSQVLDPFDTRLLKFAHHPFLELLRKDEAFNLKVRNLKIVWEQDLIWELYKTMKNAPKFEAFLSNENIEDESEVIKDIIRDLVFLNESFYRFFEQVDLYWAEDRSVIRTLSLKTVKQAQENGYTEIKIFSLSRTWSEDRTFFVNLYGLFAEQERQNEEFIFQKLKKWDSDRVALLDRIIMLLAITEIRHSPSIPVKVSINEYLEIAKSYSTPKSAQFIHGILDAVTEDLHKQGLVKKSGRGLLDNQAV